MKTITTLVCLLAFLSLANTSQAQTKEETIAWLKDKLSKYMVGNDFYVSNVTLVSIDECTIVFNYTFNNERSFRQTLPTAITSIDNNGYFSYSAAAVSDQKQGEEAKYAKKSYLLLAEREENIRARVEKALKHLATFCPKKQETF